MAAMVAHSREKLNGIGFERSVASRLAARFSMYTFSRKNARKSIAATDVFGVCAMCVVAGVLPNISQDFQTDQRRPVGLVPEHRRPLWLSIC